MTRIVKTQAEFDALPSSFSEFTVIEIRASVTISVVKVPDSSSVVARGSSRVDARDSSSVVAWDSSRVDAWDSSSVVASGSVAVRCESDQAVITLFWFAVCLKIAAGKIKKFSARATVVEVGKVRSTDDWLECAGIKPDRYSRVVLFKRVSKGWLTQEGTDNETTWAPGSTLTHPAWSPKSEECGGGKFHACHSPAACDEFRSTEGDRYVAIRVKVSDLYAWVKNPSYPSKIAFRAGKVLYEVDRLGERILVKR